MNDIYASKPKDEGKGRNAKRPSRESRGGHAHLEETHKTYRRHEGKEKVSKGAYLGERNDSEVGRKNIHICKQKERKENKTTQNENRVK